jgi:hypothetical protein
MSIHTSSTPVESTPNPTWQAALVAQHAVGSISTIARSWDEVFDAPPAQEPLARRIFREAVSEVAAKAKVALPQCNGRVHLAVKIVLASDVIPMEDGRFFVGSQSDPDTHYVVAGECDCKDSDREEIQGWCKHRLASAIYTRATAVARERMRALTEPTPQAPAATTASTLPKAPASANFYVKIGSRMMQLTLRDVRHEAR